MPLADDSAPAAQRGSLNGHYLARYSRGVTQETERERLRRQRVAAETAAAQADARGRRRRRVAWAVLAAAAGAGAVIASVLAILTGAGGFVAFGAILVVMILLACWAGHKPNRPDDSAGDSYHIQGAFHNN